ncbi:Endonuclease/exonuclease/phosphatase [Polychytrium aggregatum]|uniref:Endonuclease/exonuclease/phosphatase n=1 Tax=Polychytrium aggregatum TaxID=110093 RepID=UPI0022FE3091|nr:Endonuclease/exonuclease/phosphatase [Polychytrium aggregatum]KAI9202094.1 Endonuclease/exonuclease/phosphatase [Polychytrium aggregatum]
MSLLSTPAHEHEISTLVVTWNVGTNSHPHPGSLGGEPDLTLLLPEARRFAKTPKAPSPSSSSQASRPRHLYHDLISYDSSSSPSLYTDSGATDHSGGGTLLDPSDPFSVVHPLLPTHRFDDPWATNSWEDDSWLPEEWRRPKPSPVDDSPVIPNIVVFGLQEIESQVTAAIRLPHNQPPCIGEPTDPLLALWAERMLAALEKVYGHTYTVLQSQRMVALGLIVFVDPAFQQSRRLTIEGRWMGVAGSGLAGLYGNKGAIATAIDFRYEALPRIVPYAPNAASVMQDMMMRHKMESRGPFRFSLCFVNCHLQAHEGQAYQDMRDAEVDFLFSSLIMTPNSDIVTGTDLHDGDAPSTPIPEDRHPILPGLPRVLSAEQREMLDPLIRHENIVNPNGLERERFEPVPEQPHRLIKDNNLIFMFGDFNYRFVGASSTLSRGHVNGLIDSQEIEKLVKLDQLWHGTRSETRTYHPFKSFVEAPISFLPTYKHSLPPALPSEPALKRYSSKRVPAYCDRILYSVTDNVGTPDLVDVLHYGSATEIGWSDHQPVSGLFLIHVNEVEYLNDPGFGSRTLTRTHPQGLNEIQALRIKRFVSNSVWILAVLAAMIIFLLCLRGL